MILTHRNNFYKWWLYLLYVGFWSAIILAMTNTFVRVLGESSFHSVDGEVEEANDDEKFIGTSRARSIKCVPMIKLFRVELTEPLRPGEGVGLTGDHTKLGEWQIDKSLVMKKSRRSPLNWYRKIAMCSALRIYYRYFIYYIDSRGFKRLRYWEGQQHARVLEAYEMFHFQGAEKFGHAHAVALGGGVQHERAWLRNEYIIQLKFIWLQHIRFNEFSRFIRKPKYMLKLEVYQNIVLNEDTELQVTRFGGTKSKLKNLPEQGEFYQPGDIVILHITTANFLENLYILGIYTRQQELLGEVEIHPKAITSSEGILELPIFDVRGNSRVGWLTLPFLRVKALAIAAKFNMRASFHHYWPYNWPTLDIGHRGLGESFKYHFANAVENTIESFLKAEEVNSDMIQLNVQLTKDYVPIVWHDFGFFTASPQRSKKSKGSTLSYVYIHELTYQDLLKKSVYMLIKGIMLEVTHLNTVFAKDKSRIFPLLGQVYKKLSTTLGIVVDIKWPQLLNSGSFESVQSLDKNRYVDEILETTDEFGCGRPLIMASFDADICTMLRFKQHMYPVVFLTRGQHSSWEPYADLRTHSLASAIQFVQASDILGTAVYSSELNPDQNNTEDLNMAFELQQLVFVWCDQLTDNSLRQHFKNMEMAGLLYNRIDTILTQRPQRKRKRFRFFEAKELQRIFLRQCIAAGNMSISESSTVTHSPFLPRFRSVDEL